MTLQCYIILQQTFLSIKFCVQIDIQQTFFNFLNFLKHIRHTK